MNTIREEKEKRKNIEEQRKNRVREREEERQKIMFIEQSYNKKREKNR